MLDVIQKTNKKPVIPSESHRISAKLDEKRFRFTPDLTCAWKIPSATSSSKRLKAKRRTLNLEIPSPSRSDNLTITPRHTQTSQKL